MTSQNEPSQKWMARFNTKDGMYHPVRFVFDSPASESQARHEADRYIVDHLDWLTGIDEIYPDTAP